MSDYTNDPYGGREGENGQQRHRRSDRHRSGKEANVSREGGDTYEAARKSAENVYQSPRPSAGEPEIQWARRQPAMPDQDAQAGGAAAPYRYTQDPDGGYRPRAVAQENGGAEGEDEYRPFPWLKVMLIALAVLAILAVAGMAILGIGPFKEDGIGSAGQDPSGRAQTQQTPGALNSQDAPAAYSFQAVRERGTTESGLTFRLVTSPSVQDAAVWDREGNRIESTAVVGLDAEGNREWTLEAVFPEPYEGQVFAAIHDGNAWSRTDLSSHVTVEEPAPLATETPLPTQKPFVTAIPAPTQTPAAAVTETPAPAPTATATPVETWAPTNAPLPTQTPTAAPTDPPRQVPEETATPEPTAEPTAVPTQGPTPVPTQTPLPKLSASAGSNSLKVTDTVYQAAKSLSFTRANSYQAPHPDLYSRHDIGVFTFRGDNFRRNAAFGTVNVTKEQLSILWQTPIGSLKVKSGTMYGVGWTGQPAIIKWTIQARAMMNLYEDKKDVTGLREVIFGAQDGKIYFLDIRDGSATRDPISVGYPLKGSVSVNSLGMPLLAVGQGISQMPDGKQHPIGLHLYSLTDGKEAYFLNGRQSKDKQVQYNTNGAFDGTALFLYDDIRRGSAGDAMIVAGENGLLYTVDLNSKWSFPTEEEPDKEYSFSIAPSITYLRTKANAEKNDYVGVESSVAMYDKYIFMADTYGIIRCVNSDDMRTVWAVDGEDNIDAAIALDMDDSGTLSLYTGNTAYLRLGKKKNVTIRRLDAMTGDTVWTYEIKCDNSGDQLSGCKASPVIGQHSIDDLVIFTVNMVQGGGSRIIALEKATGQVRWEHSLKATAISSPVAVYNDNGDAWIIQGDEGGTLTMLSGKTGAVRTTLDLGGTIQGSPAVYKNYLVIGTCDKDNAYMYGIRIE